MKYLSINELDNRLQKYHCQLSVVNNIDYQESKALGLYKISISNPDYDIDVSSVQPRELKITTSDDDSIQPPVWTLIGYFLNTPISKRDYKDFHGDVNNSAQTAQKMLLTSVHKEFIKTNNVVKKLQYQSKHPEIQEHSNQQNPQSKKAKGHSASELKLSRYHACTVNLQLTPYEVAKLAQMRQNNLKYGDTNQDTLHQILQERFD